MDANPDVSHSCQLTFHMHLMAASHRPSVLTVWFNHRSTLDSVCSCAPFWHPLFHCNRPRAEGLSSELSLSPQLLFVGSGPTLFCHVFLTVCMPYPVKTTSKICIFFP
ncbi:rCG41304 [Rattus norvegicus]|uniref:RCG41304 n=1 Tax=Rattus norvegicus TaxID=10116 RepID=A6II19_RAT|nr:rCG41304 [Rattus norvegicus]